MVWRKKFKLTLLLIFLLAGWNVQSQEEPIPLKQVEQAPPPKMSQKDWIKAADNINYGERDEHEEEKEEESNQPDASDSSDLDFDPPFDWSFGLNKTAATIILSIIIILIVVLIIYLFVKQMRNGDIQVKPLADDTIYTLEEIEENLPETDLEKHLRLALEAEDYKAAVRVYYLAIIQSLSKKNHIEWHREKTNYDYILELSGNSYFSIFSKLTLTFEIIWYGDADVTKQTYESLSPNFSYTLKSIEDGDN